MSVTSDGSTIIPRTRGREECDTGSPASPDYGPTGNKFTGTIDWVQLDIGDDDHDHLIEPEDRFSVAMSRQ